MTTNEWENYDFFEKKLKTLRKRHHCMPNAPVFMCGFCHMRVENLLKAPEIGNKTCYIQSLK